MADKDIKTGKLDEQGAFVADAAVTATSPFVQVSTEVKDGDNKVPLTYVIPSFGHFATWFSQLPDESKDGASKRQVYDRFVYAVDLRERAGVRESAAAESTIITVKGKPVDIMAMPPLKAVQAVNAAILWASTTGKEPAKAAVVARRKLVENGTAVDEQGMLKLVKK